MNSNPCLTCGACCAWPRVSFYWTEADDMSPGGVPVGLTMQVPGAAHLRCMRGTEAGRGKCVALHGEVGEAVSCSIYERRSTTCREFPLRLENGDLNPKCNELRAHLGLPPLDDGLFPGTVRTAVP